jgi:hypothetical protein
MKPTRIILFAVLLMTVALYCWRSVPPAQPPRIRFAETRGTPQPTFLLKPTNATITGILTDPEFRRVIRALEQRTATDVLSAPKVTTFSSRSKNRMVFDETFVITNR